MAKTEATLELERRIWGATHKQGVFGCFEVTIGWYGKERVDYMTYDTKGIFRCYEIKVTKADFHSKAHNTFIGHFNYYVLPQELFEQVKDEIPSHVGVFVGGSCVKKAKRQNLREDEQVLKDSLIRSLCRDVGKQISSRNPTLIETLNREISNQRRSKEHYRDELYRLQNKLFNRFGSRWNKFLEGEEDVCKTTV